jgi:hypothetical protein
MTSTVEIARQILEHHCARRFDSVFAHESLVSGQTRLRLEGGRDDVESGVEHLGKAERGERALGMGDVAIGEDMLAPGQGGNRPAEARVGRHGRIVDVVDLGQIGERIDAVFQHQAVQCRAVLEIEPLLQDPCFVAAQAGQALDIGGHAPVDLGEQVAAARIERVVEVEDPVGDARKGRRRLRRVHGSF